MRVGLIAMSGIRACDPELMRLGLSLPGFVERGQVIASLPSLGLLTLAGMTPKSWELEYVEVRDLGAGGGIVRDRFDLVAISSFSAQIQDAYSLAAQFRAAGIPVVLGGLHASMMPEEAASYCDCVVVGEGEMTWPLLLRDFERGELKPSYGSLNASFDLNDAPIPAYELLDAEKYNRLTVQTSRGCPLRCDFCASSILLTQKYKQKPRSKVLAEIRKIKELWTNPFIEFADDNSVVDRRYWKELLPELQKEHIPWFAETDVSVADDNDLLGLMRDSGCAELLIGLESPVGAGLDGLEMKSNWKLRRFPRYRDAIRRIQSHGIRVNGCFIVGLDGHGPEIFDAIVEFVKETELYDVQVTIPTAFPGTPFYDRLRAEGRILEERAWRKCTLFDVNFRPKNMTPEALSAGFRDLVARLYNREFTTWRRRTFWTHSRESLQGVEIPQ